jgi:hypothetical protein
MDRDSFRSEGRVRSPAHWERRWEDTGAMDDARLPFDSESVKVVTALTLQGRKE